MATKIMQENQNSADFNSVKWYGDNVCVYSKVVGVGEFKYANKNFRGAKGVAIATKFTKKAKNAQISVLYVT